MSGGKIDCPAYDVVMPKQRASKWDWFERALNVLRMEGVDAVKVERLARELGIAKSGFYWHFKDRDDLLAQLVDYWAHEYTAVIAENVAVVGMEPKERLIETARLITKHGFNDCEVSMRAWALTDQEVARRVEKVYATRLRFIKRAFIELDFDEGEAELRARLYMVYHVWELATFGPQGGKKGYLKAIEHRVELLARR